MVGQHMLEPGFTVSTIVHNMKVVVEEYLGGGGQGEVYRVDWGGKPMALKWYSVEGLGSDPDAFYKNIGNNIAKGSPAEQFLWPQDITEWKNDSFGYIMELRPDGYKEFTQFLKAKHAFKNYKVSVDAALNLIVAFRILHNRGYSYQDLNDGNFFINPDNGDVLVCDNDNVAQNGTHTGIIGKPRYIAPEIVKGKMPNTYSDRFSMAIILFLMFTHCHPLEGIHVGEVVDDNKKAMLYGFDPVFIFDPHDASNRPREGVDDGAIRFWKAIPDYMKELFIKAFSKECFQNPDKRPIEADWMKVLVRFRSDIVRCAACGDEVFTMNCQGICDKCGSRIELSNRLELRRGRYFLPMTVGTRIYRCQTMTCNPENALNPVAAITRNPRDKTKLGLLNISTETWRITTHSGKKLKNEPQTIVPIVDDVTIMVNGSEMVIHTK